MRINTHWTDSKAFRFGFPAFLFLASFLLKLYIFTQNPYANGWDGYFYIVQVKSWIEEGQMHSSRISLFYPLLLFLYFLTDYELAYQLISALAAGLFSLAIYQVGVLLAGSRNLLTPMMIAGYSAISFHLTYFAAQFPKNLLGLAFLLWFLLALFQEKYIRAGIFLVLNLLIHKLTGGLALVLFLLYPLIRHRAKFLLYSSIAAASIMLASGFFFPQILSIADFQREGFALTAVPGLPFLSMQASYGETMHAWWLTEIFFINLAFITTIPFLIFQNRPDKHRFILLGIFLFVLTFPFLEWSFFGLSLRLYMLFIALAPLMMCMVRIRNTPKTSWLLLMPFFLAGAYSTRAYSYKEFDPPYSLYHSLSKDIEQLKGQHSFELLIGHKALAEYVTFRTGIDVLPWIPEYEIEVDALWRIATGLRKKTVEFYLGKDTDIYELSPSYILLREDKWQELLRYIEEDDPELYEDLCTWKNPYEIRPAYLLKNKK
ncbi:MAG: hypothetical protein ACK4ND_15115 [Cytophagaceae bacterium]